MSSLARSHTPSERVVPTPAPPRGVVRSQRVGEVLVQLDGRIEAGAPPPPSGREAVAQTEEAASIVEQARRYADEIVGVAAGEVRRLEEESRRTGFEAGYQEGVAQAREELAGALGLVQSAAREGHAVRQQLLEDAEPRFVELAIEAVREVVGELVSVDEALAAATVRRALNRAGAQLVVRVRVHPDDEAAIRAELHEDGAGDADWVLTPDGRVTLGGCIVDTTHGLIDARLDVQVEALARRLRGALPHAA